jgi:hypothetical protein
MRRSEIIEAMTAALERAVASLPEPASSSHLRQLAESILRTAKSGEASADILGRGLRFSSQDHARRSGRCGALSR